MGAQRAENPDYALYNTVYMYDSPKSANAGVARGGSGLLCSVSSSTVPGFEHRYVVTNQHVISQGYTTVRAMSMTDEPDFYEISEWVSHPKNDDLAMASINLPSGEFAALALDKDCLSKERFIDHDIGIGDDVFMVSRLLDLQGREHAEPAVRFGRVALRGTAKLDQP